MVKLLKPAIILSVVGILFTALVYARPFPKRIFLYITITLFYTVLIVFLNRKFGYSHVKASLLSLVTPLIVDSSVLLTNPDFVPLRFPFASLFLLLAAILSYLIISKKLISISIGLLVAIVFFYCSDKYFIPRIISHIEQKTVMSIPPEFLAQRFLNNRGDTVRLSSFLKTTSFIDFYFVGCAPCKTKEKMFKQLVKEHPDEDYSAILICNGSISKYSDFLTAISDSFSNRKLYYLYDYGGQIGKYLPDLNSYPFEAVVKNEKFVKYYWGMNKESYELNVAERIRYIKVY